MKTQRNILLAFLLNLGFSIFEFVGGIVTGSVAIASDALHDLGDAVGIGISYVMERKSKDKPDAFYTYGYGRYSALGGLITTSILLLGAFGMIVKAVGSIVNPAAIDYYGMIFFAIVGVAVNLLAALLTHKGESVNQRAVNLHMLEDVLGWAVVLLGAVVMHFTDFALLDPLMSIAVSVFIIIHAIENLREILALFLEKTPKGLNVAQITAAICQIDGVEEVHHFHLWSFNGSNHCATMHLVTDRNGHDVKDAVRRVLNHYSICHATLELESTQEHCHDRECHMEAAEQKGHHHHHH